MHSLEKMVVITARMCSGFVEIQTRLSIVQRQTLVGISQLYYIIIECIECAAISNNNNNNVCSIVSMMDSKDSWVARWQRIERFTPGVYAIQVYGRLPEDVIGDLESRGYAYKPRDGSFN